jgi:hypothetical protein
MAMAKKKPAPKKPWTGSKEDEKADKKVMQGMNPKQQAAFKKGDKKMDAKNPSKSADMKMDAKLAKKVTSNCSCGKCAACKAKKKKPAAKGK